MTAKSRSKTVTRSLLAAMPVLLALLAHGGARAADAPAADTADQVIVPGVESAEEQAAEARKVVGSR